MRKILISLLLASAAATPALAGPRDFTDRQDARAERQQARDDARAQRSAERAQPAPRAEQPTFVRPPNAYPNGRANFDTQRAVPVQQRQQIIDQRATDRAEQRQQRIDQRQQRIDQRQQQIEQVRDNGGGRQSPRPPSNVGRTRTPVVSNVPRFGTQPPLRTESHNTVSSQWRSGWRHDNRYNWQDWRRHHRSIFHLGFYIDPFGWGYQPYSIGWRLWPNYYSSSFWIDDPWMYRLPYAPPGTRWIRYYNDALLVDIWTGEVVDAIPDFFW